MPIFRACKNAKFALQHPIIFGVLASPWTTLKTEKRKFAFSWEMKSVSGHLNKKKLQEFWTTEFFFQASTPPPPPPPTTLIPHIEVGFKWMWTQLATPNKMAPVFVDLCAGLVVLLPRQIRRFRHGFFSSAVLDWSLRSCVRVRHLWRQQIADNRRYLRRSFLPWTSSLRSQISLSKRR